MKLFVLLTLVMMDVAFGQATSVKIENLSGKVLYYRDRTISVMTERTHLKNDDLLMTKDGRVSLVFEDTTLTFTPHSIFRVMNLKNNERHQFGEFLIGEYFSTTRKKLVDRKRLEVLLPKAKIHVLGTRYLVQIAPNVEKLLERQEGTFSPQPRLELIPETVSNNDLVTQVTCFEGKVSIKTDSGQSKDLVVNESALYSGSGANLRVSMKDQSELMSQLENLGLSSNSEITSGPNPVE